MQQLFEARKLAKELYAAYESPYTIVEKLDAAFEDSFFYLSHGNIFRCKIGDPIADMVYDKRRDLLSAEDV